MSVGDFFLAVFHFLCFSSLVFRGLGLLYLGCTLCSRAEGMAVWPLNSLIPLEEEENRAISPVVFAGQT